MNVGGPEWRKWCSDEGPLRKFGRRQKAWRRAHAAREIRRIWAEEVYRCPHGQAIEHVGCAICEATGKWPSY